jgi:hypothetical protein
MTVTTLLAACCGLIGALVSILKWPHLTDFTKTGQRIGATVILTILGMVGTALVEAVGKSTQDLVIGVITGMVVLLIASVVAVARKGGGR